jgi:hypothetical protein
LMGLGRCREFILKSTSFLVFLLGLCAAALVACGGSLSVSVGNDGAQSPPPASPAPTPPPAERALTLLAGAVGEKVDSVAIGRNIFIFPEAIAVTASYDAYVADAGRILRVSRSGTVSHFSALEACYFFHGASLDAVGNVYTSCDSAVYRVSPVGVFALVAGSKGESGFADGAANAARFSSLLSDVLADADGNVFVADLGNSRVRKISKDGMVSTLAGSGEFASADGVGTAAAIARPSRLGLDLQGNVLVADSCALRRITPAGVVTTIAGRSEQCVRVDGAGTAARLMDINGIAVDRSDNIFLADDKQIRMLAPSGQVTTMVGALSGLGRIQGMSIDRNSNLLVVDADSPNQQIRLVTPEGVVSVHAGTESLKVLTRPKTIGYIDGSALNARFNAPRGIAADASGNIFVPDMDNGVVRKVSAGGVVTTVASKLALGFSVPVAAAVDGAGNVFVIGNDARLRRIAPDDAVSDVPLPTAPLYPGYDRGRPLAIAADLAGKVFVAFEVSKQVNPSCVSTGMTPCQRSYKVSFHQRATYGSWTMLANSDHFYRNSDGNNAANLIQVGGMAVDRNGTLIFSDPSNHTILSWSANGAAVLVPPSAGLRYPTWLQVDAAGNVYVVDNSGLTIRMVTPDGVVSTIAGTAGKNDLILGTAPASLSEVSGLAWDAKGYLVLSVAHGLVTLGPR